MGPGFESQRDHKAPKKFGAFFMQAKASGRNRNARVKARQACLVELERIALQRAKRVLPRTLLH
jgi:hypothetical protein